MPKPASKPLGWLILATAALAAVGGVAAMNRPPERVAARPAAPQPADADGWETHVRKAEEQVQKTPNNPETYHLLAIALMRGQRETGDPELFLRAEKALLEAKRQKPDDYMTRKLMAWVLAGQHRFDEAVTIARECVRQNPADFWNYGVIGDALTETGDYEGALVAVQKMVDLRPGSLSYARAADQRRLHGDPQGALELYDLALEATGPREREALAWTRTQMGDLHFFTGDLKAAGTAYAAALQQVPSYYLALAGRAQLLAAQGKLAEAASAWDAALAQVQRPDWMAAQGDVYQALGQKDKAEARYREVEAYLNARMDDPTADAGHQLAQFLADRGRDPKRAMELAKEEAANATDIAACDTLGWAYYHTGNYPEAWKAAQRAMRLKTRDPKILYHAGMIALRLPEQQGQGKKLLAQALALNGAWHPLDAPAARKALPAPAVASAASKA